MKIQIKLFENTDLKPGDVVGEDICLNRLIIGVVDKAKIRKEDGKNALYATIELFEATK